MFRHRHIIFILALTICQACSVSAQDWEYGVWAGLSNYFGDLNNHASFEYMGPGTGVFARYNINSRFANRVAFNYGIIAGSDASSPDPFERARNLSFKSNVVEIGDQLEFNFFRYDKRKPQYCFTPYLFTGLSAFYFNPKATLDGVTYSLQPIGTEGQNAPGSGVKKYLRASLAIPVGGGFKYSFHPAWALGLEFGYRKTLTNYLDDVGGVYPAKVVSYTTSTAIAQALSDRSGEVGEPIGVPGKQRGDSNGTDSYMFLGFTISYTMLKERCPKISNIH